MYNTCVHCTNTNLATCAAQVVFVAPASTPEQAKELARKSTALQVRSQVVIRWVLWLTRAGGASERWPKELVQVQRDQRMLHVLHNGPAMTVPEQLLTGALHARDETEAQTMAAAFDRGREGYARTRVGREEDPAVHGGESPLEAWADGDPPQDRTVHDAGPSSVGAPAGDMQQHLQQQLQQQLQELDAMVDSLALAVRTAPAQQQPELEAQLMAVERARADTRVVMQSELRLTQARAEQQRQQQRRRHARRQQRRQALPGVLGEAELVRQQRILVDALVDMGFEEPDGPSMTAVREREAAFEQQLQNATGAQVTV